MLFLIPILHQTTTTQAQANPIVGCSSFQFYIKPQRPARSLPERSRCSSFQFYIKPQRRTIRSASSPCCSSFQFYIKPQLPSRSPISDTSLFLIPILHQTTTLNNVRCGANKLFLIPILHQTTTAQQEAAIQEQLFLIPILHQTTTSRMAVIHILHVTHMTPMHKTSCRTPGKLVGCNFVFQRAIYQKNSSC